MCRSSRGVIRVMLLISGPQWYVPSAPFPDLQLILLIGFCAIWMMGSNQLL